ncbi:MAG: type IV secretory system conjugative DNA transfer family protein [Pseudomonadota bacterium]
MFNNEIDRFGSAAFADERQVRAAGAFKAAPDSLFLGYLGNRPLIHSGAGGALLVAGARSGKLSTILGRNLCYGTATACTFVTLDMKGELYAISQNQTPDQKYCIGWNPAGLHGLPQHRINPVDYICADSPTLVSDVKVFCENMIPPSGAAQSVYFEGRAREFLEGIILTEVRRSGTLTLPKLYEIINLIPGNTDTWLEFAWLMNQSGFPISVRIEEEIAASRENPSNGFQGILGELFKAFACLSDPILLTSVSPPYDFSFADLCHGDRRWQVYLMPPAEFVSAWSPVIKAMFVAGMIYKSRNPSAPRQTWVLDECAQLGAFPLVIKLFTYGAGIGIRPWAIFQATQQMRQLGPNAETIITSSAAVRSYFGIRDIESATALSRMLGAQTLQYDDEAQQAQARLAKSQAMQSLLMGEDPLAVGVAYKHHSMAAERQTKMHRLLRTPDEILSTPHDKQYIFYDGLASPIYADRRPYYEERSMAGLFHPNPYHPPVNKVRVRSAWGHTWRSVVTEPVPERFSQYPQYKDGYWSRVE